jgi:hypothetical protein
MNKFTIRNIDGITKIINEIQHHMKNVTNKNREGVLEYLQTHYCDFIEEYPIIFNHYIRSGHYNVQSAQILLNTLIDNNFEWKSNDDKYETYANYVVNTERKYGTFKNNNELVKEVRKFIIDHYKKQDEEMKFFYQNICNEYNEQIGKLNKEQEDQKRKDIFDYFIKLKENQNGID